MEGEDGKFTTVPNGRRGRVCAGEFSGKVELWISEWKSWYAPTPAINVFFDLGEVGYSMRKKTNISLPVSKMDPEALGLSSTSKLFEYEKLSREIDKSGDMEQLKTMRVVILNYI